MVSPLLQGSDLPLSIIILGMGDADFHFMEILDGDSQVLKYNGQESKRDVNQKYCVNEQMVQFVSFEELRNKSCEEIVESLLFELPRQFMDYMNGHQLSPDTIRDA